MPINQWSKPAQLQITPLPFAEIAQAGLAKQKQYDDSDAILNSINDNFLKVGSIPADDQEKLARVTEFQKKAQEIVDSNHRDLATALPQIKQLQREAQQELTYGKLGGIQQRFNGYLKSVEEIDKLAAKYVESGGKEGMSDEQARLLKEYELGKLNNKPIAKTSTGGWEPYRPFERQPTVDVHKESWDRASKMKPETIAWMNGLTPTVGPKGEATGYYRSTTGEVTRLTKEHIANVVSKSLLTDPRMQKYYKWKYTIDGTLDNIASTVEANPYGIPGDSQEGPVTMAPEQWSEQVLTKEIRDAALSAGELYQQYAEKKDQDFTWDKLGELEREMEVGGINPWTLPVKTEPGAGDYRQTVKELGVTSTGEVVPQKQAPLAGVGAGIVELAKTAGSTLMYALNRARGNTNLVDDVGFAERVNNFPQRMAAALKGKDNIEVVDNMAKVARESFPNLNGLFPYEQGVKNGRVYDKNAGVVSNLMAGAYESMKNTAGKVMGIENPKLRQKIEDNFLKSGFMDPTMPIGTLSIPGQPDLQPEDVLEQIEGAKDIKFMGIGDWTTGGSLMWNVDGQVVQFDPSDEISGQALEIVHLAQEALATHERIHRPIKDPNNPDKIMGHIILTPGLIPGVNQDKQIDKSGNNSRFSVKVQQIDPSGNPINFPGFSTNVLGIEDYYKYIGFANYLELLSGTKQSR
jgi:hypothetical protein